MCFFVYSFFWKLLKISDIVFCVIFGNLLVVFVNVINGIFIVVMILVKGL